MDEKTKLAAEIARDIVCTSIGNTDRFISSSQIICQLYADAFETVYQLLSSKEETKS